MIDSRLIQAQEAAAAGITNLDRVVGWLIRDTLTLVEELAEENLPPHERVDIAQAKSFLLAAAQRVTNAQHLLELACQELKAAHS
jgi:hypothetical protein